MAKFYDMMTFVGNERVRQVFIVDGWTLTMEGQGDIPCTLPGFFFFEIKPTNDLITVYRASRSSKCYDFVGVSFLPDRDLKLLDDVSANQKIKN